MHHSKILIVIPRSNPAIDDINYQYFFPIGLGYISGILKQAGYPVDCLNLNHKKGSVENIIAGRLSEKKYDYVATGNVGLGYTITEKIINVVSKHESRPKVILGGLIITTESELIFNSLNPDFGVIGEGEETILELLKCLEQGEDIEKVKGIAYRNKDGKTIFTERREEIKDIESLPIPDFDGFGFEEQLEHTRSNDYAFAYNFDYPRVYPILGSRGCPFNCTFCYHYTNYRARSIPNIMAELNTMVRRFKINIITVYDECLAVKRERIDEFCKGITKLRAELPWDLKWMCQMSVRSVNKETLKTMKEAGCTFIGYGFESFSPVVLKSMRKPITPQQIDQAFHETFEAGIAIQANFIFGDIAETAETASQTLDYWKKNYQGQVTLGFISPYPGSEIYYHCLRRGIIKDKLDFIKNKMHDLINMTEAMTDKEFKRLRNDLLEADGNYRKYVNPISIKKDGNTYEVELECPYCNKLITYKNYSIKKNYEILMICRNCYKHFVIVSFLRKLLYDNHLYSKIKRLKLFYARCRGMITSAIKGISPGKKHDKYVVLGNGK